jgi:diguanylate cyclase
MALQDLPILALSAAVGAAATVMFAMGAWRDRARPAARCWGAALLLASAGAALAALGSSPVLGLAGQWLMLAWPLAVLGGLRRHGARQRWPGSPRLDLALWACAALVVAADTLDPQGPGVRAALAPLLLHVLTTGMLLTAAWRPAGQDRHGFDTGSFTGTPSADASSASDVNLALGLALLLLATGLAPGLLTGSVEAPLGTLAGRTAALAVGAVVLAGLALTLLHQRREQRLRASRRRLRELANLDALTQVPNRRHFSELVEHALQHDRPGSAVLIVFDIDHFKQINDRLGHAAGDRALCLVAQAMVQHLREDDVAGRFGGDEFVLLLRQAQTTDAMRAARRIVSAVQRQARPLQLPALTLSFGMVQVGLAEPLPDALRRADQALYEAKRQGRSRAVAAQGAEHAPVFAESQRLGLTPH